MKSIDDIALELSGYDPQALSADQVVDFLRRLVDGVGVLGLLGANDAQVQLITVGDALGRVLAQDVVSGINVPAHDNSAMDGFAFRGSDLSSDGPTTFAIVGTAMAGQAWAGVCANGQCVRIMTGAVMPLGLDTVVPHEFASVTADQLSIPNGCVRALDNRRLAGEDISLGQVALPRGTRLGAAALGLLASLGVPSVKVVRRLKVAYFSTGDEVLSLGDAPREGAVYDSNRYTVRGMLAAIGIDVIDMGVVGDQPDLLRAAFTQAAACADAIITSGGVSVGEADFTKAMMRELGDVAFWKVAMRPGRPMAVGAIQKPVFDDKSASGHGDHSLECYQNSIDLSGPTHALLFGLPGNPVAVMVTFLAFVRPALLRLMGSTESQPPLLKASSTERLRKKPGRTEYQRGWVSLSGSGQLQVRMTGNQGSGVLSSMVQANGLIVLHHTQGDVAVGELVDVMMFQGVV